MRYVTWLVLALAYVAVSGGCEQGQRPGFPAQSSDEKKLMNTETSELTDDRGASDDSPKSEEELTKAIAALTKEEVPRRLVAVAKAKNKLRREDDPELYDSLTKEFDLLMLRMRYDRR